jgi:lipopolysaccharide assembly protein A
VSTSEVHYDETQPPEIQESGKGRKGRGQHKGRGQDGVHGTRIGSAWIAVIVAVVLGVALVDFIVQNTRSVRIEFFSANGHTPVAVALIGAALVGAFIVLAVGIARTTQLRIATRRGAKREKKAASLASSPEN